jgi:hypothetical protein
MTAQSFAPCEGCSSSNLLKCLLLEHIRRTPLVSELALKIFGMLYDLALLGRRVGPENSVLIMSKLRTDV